MPEETHQPIDYLLFRRRAFWGQMLTALGLRIVREASMYVLLAARAAGQEQIPDVRMTRLGPGVLVCNDFIEMLLPSLMDPGRTVRSAAARGLRLLLRRSRVRAAFIAYSRTVYDTCSRGCLTGADTIFHLPYGVPLPDRVRRRAVGALRLIVVGRLDEAEGVGDRPALARFLHAGVPVIWLAAGPEGSSLRGVWGLSVATVEAMSAGLVPVVGDLRCMEELADHGRTGLGAPVRNPAAFAVIADLHRDRDRLEMMSAAARQCAVDRFDIRAPAGIYQQLYAREPEQYRPRPASMSPMYGGRPDRPWIPNPFVRLIRTAIRTAR